MADQPHNTPAPAPSNDAAAPPNRRAFVFTSLTMLLAGCASSGRTTRLPDPAWPDDPVIARRDRSNDAAAHRGSDPIVASSNGVIPRSSWATGQPVPSMMNRMLPVRYITIHHAGMSAFYETDKQSVAGRLDAIRNAHRGQDWGDIGYHYAIDRAGRVWECRPIQWQGAHVGGYNEGNIGILNLGNYDLQSPSDQQVATLSNFVRQLQSTHRVPANRIKTHQEWSATRCPGETLQRRMIELRNNRTFG